MTNREDKELEKEILEFCKKDTEVSLNVENAINKAFKRIETYKNNNKNFIKLKNTGDAA